MTKKNIEDVVEDRVGVIMGNLRERIENFNRNNHSSQIMRDDLEGLVNMTAKLARVASFAADTISDNIFDNTPPCQKHEPSRHMLYTEIKSLMEELSSSSVDRSQ